MPARKATKVCYLLLFGGRTRHESFAVWHLASQGTERTPAMKTRAAGLVDLLNHNKREEYLALASRYLGFPQAR